MWWLLASALNAIKRRNGVPDAVHDLLWLLETLQVDATLAMTVFTRPGQES